MGKIRVVIKRPESKPYVSNISNTLKNLENTVGGYIETFPIATDCVIICNEKGKIMNLPHNCNLLGKDFNGTIVFAGIDGEEFTNLQIDFKDFKKMFGNLFT